MSRPKHSMAGHLMSLQMSRHNVFAFVEGIDSDPFFYSEVCQLACRDYKVTYRVRPVKELPNAAGGKNALIAFYRYARSKGKLRFTVGKKTTILIFYLDKDVDDLKRRLCRSRHVCYTHFYDVQNHIFRYGDLIKGIAAAASVDPVELRELPIFRGDWREGVVRRWKQWTALCIVAVKHNVPGSNYGIAPSSSNQTQETAQYQQKKDDVAKKLNISQVDIDLKVSLEADKVEKYLRAGTFDRVFKGKWYPSLLENDLRIALHGRSCKLNGLSGRISSTLIVTLDFSKPWAEQFISPLRALIDESFANMCTSGRVLQPMVMSCSDE